MAVRKTPHDPASRQRKPRQPAAEQAPLAGPPGKARTRARKTPAAADRASAPVDMAAVCAALEAAGVLLPPPQFDDLPSDPAEMEALIRKDEAWLLATFKEPLGLSEAVIEDRG
jgi:hypothetical protein